MSARVVIENFSYAYPSLQPATETEWILRDINLEVQAGEFVSIMGPTAVGKTTLCLALNGIVPQSTGGVIRGNVYVNGLNTKRAPVAELAQHAGIVFQDPETQFFNVSVETEIAFGLENLGLPPQEIEARVDWALGLVGMRAFKERSPFQLSGGQKQRVAIAAVLAMRPQILVLDEPTASLDPLGKLEVFSVVRSLHHQFGMTVIMAEHDSERIAEFSDRIIVLHEGTVAMEGSPDQVFSQVARLQEIGVSLPQVSELADCLNRQHGTNFNFTRLTEAYQTLTRAEVSRESS